MQTIAPAQATLSIRGESITLTAMLDADRIEWIELQVLAAQDCIRAISLAKAGKESDLRQIVTLLVTCEYSLTRRATGWTLDRCMDYTQEERKAIVSAQDELNQVGHYAALMSPFAQRASVEAMAIGE